MNLKWDEEKEPWETRRVDTGQIRTSKIKTRIWTVEDLVKQLCDILEQVVDHQDKIKATTAVQIRGTTRENLEGWSFREIVEGDRRMSPRVSILESSGRGWVDFTRSIGAVTLMGRGFGNLIAPAASAQVCQHWKQVPTGRDYLTACIYTLRAICDRFGNEEEKPLKIAHGCRWHQAHLLFEKCSCPRSKRCDRVQVLLPRNSLGRKKKPNPFCEPAGAVIFGRSERLP